ncbi:MAG: hypothetical protein H0X30_17835 [Anaerolineae bacterium]|nr:hypothetical protein [Anaerolineae bacterium]
MAKGKQHMTLAQAVEHLKTVEGVKPYKLPTLRKAVHVGKLPAKLIDAPVPYYQVTEADLIAWAAADNHKPGRKTE